MRLLAGLSPFARVILGLGLGIATGLFFGDAVAALAIGGDIYIRLLQMTVIPYVLVSLVGGLGGLDAEMARRIGIRGGSMILVLWGVTLATLFCIPLAYPSWTSAAFFSTSLIEEPAPFDALRLYIPSNPFYSLGHTIVPAVVVFAISLGLALIPVQNKDGLLRGLSNVGDGLQRIAGFVGRLAPIGIFAIAAAAAGTLRVEELSRLQVFLWVYLVAWALLTFVTLPAIVAWATPFSYREALRESQVPMVTAFATGTVLVVLPMMVDRCKELLAEHGFDQREARTSVDVLVPTAYSFPSAGTLLGLGFVLFAAWYVGSPLTVAQYPSFALVGAFAAFGSMAVAIPFMLDFFSLPSDLFQLYLLGSVVTARFATALAAMQGIVVSLLGTMAVLGKLRKRSLLQAVAGSVAISAAAMLVLGFSLTRAIPYEYVGEEAFVSMPLLGGPVASQQVVEPAGLSDAERLLPRLGVIRERGSLQVGYLPDRLPYAYRSTAGDLVGLDIDLAGELARDLGVRLELTRLSWDRAVDWLADGHLDLVLGGLPVTSEDAQRVSFTRSYLSKSLGFAVLDHRADEFPDVESLRTPSDLVIALADHPHYRKLLEREFPKAEIVTIDSPRRFFRGEVEADLLATAAEPGGAWTLIYPSYRIIVPRGLVVKGATALALPIGQPDFARFLDTWLDVARRGGLISRLERYWILGEDEGREPPRWSVMRDVLGWGNDEE